MERKDVDSSNLRSVGYDKQKHILEIEFNNKGVYHYFEVPFDIYEGLIGAESKGKYFWKNIRREFEYERVGD